jgi:hypothetical protein
MTDGDGDGDDDLEEWRDGVPIVPPPDPEAGVPDTDPEHLDPAGDLADAVEGGELEMGLAPDADREELREFLRKAERGEFDADPGLEAAVRIVRALLEEADGDADTDTGGEG